MKPKRLGSYLVIGDWGWDENAHGRLAQRAEKGDTADGHLKCRWRLDNLKEIV